MLDRETLYRFAFEAGAEFMDPPCGDFYYFDLSDGSLERFAALVAAAERDRESKMDAYIKATEFMRGPEIEGDMLTIAYMDGYAAGVKAEREACAKVCDAMPAHGLPANCAAAIRARGQQ